MTSTASATVFVFDCRAARTCPSSDDAGQMIDSVFTFDDVTLDFSWRATFDTTGEETPDGVWFAINNGPQPRAGGEGLAIFYGDGATGRVSGYVYDNTKRKNSWEIPSNFLDTYPGAISFTPRGGNLIDFDIAFNVRTVNEAFPADPDWRGLSYGNEIGFWAAALADTQMGFDTDGRITSFRHGERTSYDRGDRVTTRREAPAPATFLLLGTGIVALAANRRRRS